MFLCTLFILHSHSCKISVAIVSMYSALTKKTKKRCISMEDLSVDYASCFSSVILTATILWDGTWTITQVPERCFYLTAAGNTDRNKFQVFTRASTGAAPTHVCPQLCSVAAHSPCPLRGTAAHPGTACQTQGQVLLLFPFHKVNSSSKQIAI